jgi:hypothetical protein
MCWGAAPTGKRGRHLTYRDAAVPTCLTMKVLFWMALRQTAGFVESLLRLVRLDWTVPDLSTQSRRQKILAVNIPYRGSHGPLHLLGIASQNPAGQWTAPTTRAIATTLLQIEALMPAFHPAEMQNHGNRPRRVPSRTMRPCEPQNTWVARSGETGADTTAEVVPRPTLSGSCFA